MIAKADLEHLRAYRRQSGAVLSVYLNVDQSDAANLNRGFELALLGRLRSLALQIAEAHAQNSHAQNEFAACARQILAFISKYQARSRSLVLFARSQGPVWAREMNVPLSTDLRWESEPYVQPFIETLDEFETYAVVLADRARARIFTVILGAIETQIGISASNTVRHIKTTGTDHLFSQSNFQRKADEHSLSHLKRVVELLESTARSTAFQHLVLAGPNGATTELCRLLPKSLRHLVVASTVMRIDATEKEVLEQTLGIERQAERAYELRHTKALITSAAKGVRAVTAIPDTLGALKEKRVRELIYAEGLAASPGILQCALGLALEQSAGIEQVRGDAAERLNAVGGMGAFLRF